MHFRGILAARGESRAAYARRDGPTGSSSQSGTPDQTDFEPSLFERRSLTVRHRTQAILCQRQLASTERANFRHHRGRRRRPFVLERPTHFRRENELSCLLWRIDAAVVWPGVRCVPEVPQFAASRRLAGCHRCFGLHNHRAQCSSPQAVRQQEATKLVRPYPQFARITRNAPTWRTHRAGWRCEDAIRRRPGPWPNVTPAPSSTSASHGPSNLTVRSPSRTSTRCCGSAVRSPSDSTTVVEMTSPLTSRI